MEIAFLNDILFLCFFYSFLDIFNDQSLHTFIITINVCAMKCEKNGFFITLEGVVKNAFFSFDSPVVMKPFFY